MSVFLALVASLFVFALPASAHIASRTPRLLEAPLQRYKLNLGRVKPQTVRNAAKYFAEKDLDVAGVNFQSRTVELIIPSQVASEIRTRFNVEVVPVAEEGMAVDPRFVNPERLEAKMTALAKANPDLVSLHVLGKSTEGRPILALQITKPGPAIKPAILIDGNHHAREIMTPEVAFDVAETLVTAAKSSPPSVRRNILSVLERAEIWVLPMLNPDGNNIVWKSDTWWRKNARATNSRVHGVDLNRNYTFQWGACNGSSGDKSSDQYRGEAPASEPETQAIIALGEHIRPIGYLSYHSFGEMVLSPYSCSNQLSAEAELVETMGKRLQGRLPTDSGRGTYVFGTSWQILYPVDGGSKDFFHAAFGTVGYTLEINNSFQPSYDLREPTLKKHRVAWMGFINDLLDNTLVVRVQDAKGRALSAKIEVQGIQHKYGERPFMTNEQGILHKVLLPGTYRLRATTEDGASREVTVEMKAGSANTADFQF